MPDSQLLAPWEYEGAIPQVDQAGETSHKGRLVQFELLQATGQFDRIVIRIGEDEGSWTVSSHLASGLRLERVEEHVSTALTLERYVRDFRFGDEQVIVRPNGIGFWYEDDIDWHLQEMPHFCLGRRISKLTSSQTREWILRLRARPSSDISFARRFMNMSNSQRWSYVFGFATEREYLWAIAQLETLWKCVLYTDNNLWRGRSRLQWLIRSGDDRKSSRLWLPAKWDNHPSNIRLREWTRVIQQFGMLSRPLRMEHVCSQSFFNPNSVLAQGWLSAPTAHEHLEARLALHDWGQRNLPPETWAELKQFEDSERQQHF